jgi:transcriptional regulator with XRE-family HTH domain
MMNIDQLPKDIRAWLESVPKLTNDDLEELRRASEALDKDPSFRAELIKGRFVAEMLSAMEETGKTQAEVARAWGKTRQYLNKLLNEDKRVNFTVETLCELAHLLNRRVDLQILRENETAHVVRSIPVQREIESLEAHWPIPNTRLQPLNDVQTLYGQVQPTVTPVTRIYEVPDLAA